MTSLFFNIFGFVLPSLKEAVSICWSIHTPFGAYIHLFVRQLVTHELKPKVPFLTKTNISTSENASYAVYPALF